MATKPREPRDETPDPRAIREVLQLSASLSAESSHMTQFLVITAIAADGTMWAIAGSSLKLGERAWKSIPPLPPTTAVTKSIFQ